MSYRDNHGLKKFLKRFIILTIVLFFLDFLIGGVLSYLYFNEKSGLLFRTTYAIDSTRADILVFGSSRANHHYVPTIFANKLHMTFYNCGRDGSNLIYHAAIISAVLERYSPKQIIIDLTPNELCVSEEGRLSALLPYHNNQAISPFIKYNSKFENYKLISKMYPYNSLLTNIIVGNLAYNKSRFNEIDGYIGLNNVMPFHKKELFKQGSIINDRVNILSDLFRKLYKRNIQVTLVVSPSYFSFEKNDPVIAVFKKLTARYNNFNFLNYENDPHFTRSYFFNDDDHLNNFGAQKFSEDVANKLINK